MWATLALAALVFVVYCNALGQKCDLFNYPSHLSVDEFGRPGKGHFEQFKVIFSNRLFKDAVLFESRDFGQTLRSKLNFFVIEM
jgi:hypothetical protein